MTALIISIGIVILIIVIIISSKDKKKDDFNPPPINTNNYETSVPQSSRYSSQPTPVIETPLPAKLMNMNIESNSITSSPDDSIIDVTGNSFDIKKNSLTKYEKGVPYWPHQFVYSYSEISVATTEQQQFYNYFKYRFLKGEYLDTEGNSNYYFILLFDLLDNEYQQHKNILLLENQLAELSYYYPKTASYAKNFLIKKAQSINSIEVALRILNRSFSANIYNPSGEVNYENYWGLGNKYKSKLNLSDDDVKILNAIPFPNNNFFDIEFCRMEVIKFFLAYIKILKQHYAESGSSIEKDFEDLADFVATKHFRYKQGSYNYKYSLDSIKNEIYINIFKHAENAVRAAYEHKRKLNTECFYATLAVKERFEAVISSNFIANSQPILNTIQEPDSDTLIELNAQNTTRWKINFEQIKRDFIDRPTEFFKEIIKLGELNKKNPAVENIFLEASKTIAKKDKEISLKLYIYYLYYDLKSATFDNKQLTKTIQKSLFKTNEQLHEFEIIISDLINDKNLEKSLERIPSIHAVKRKKITLDKASIQEVQHQHSGTVDLLNEYLDDEYDDEKNTIISREISKEEVSIQIQSKKDQETVSPYNKAVNLTDIQMLALELFVKGNFSIPQSEVEAFAKERNVFRNQLVESINDCCYETLDDILIEEDEEYYQINQDYYKRILQ